MSDSDNEKLNLPAIKRRGQVSVRPKSKKIKPLDLDKSTALSKAMGNQTTAQEDVARREMGLDLVLVGDLTGSMGSYHRLLKEKFSELCSSLFRMIPNLKIGIIFYLDHGSNDPYVTKFWQLTSDQQALQKFINETSTGCGGDEDEAVEDAFNDVVNNMNWRQSGGHSVVLFGDASPHESSECPSQYDYFFLAQKMEEMSITVNSVFCRPGFSNEELEELEKVDIGDFSKRVSRLSPPNFFSWVANVTGGMIIGVEQIDELIEIIQVAAAKDSGKLDEFAKSLKSEDAFKLKLIPIAKKAEKRKGIAMAEKAKLLGHKKG